jgi:hypothetical protein
MSSRFFSRFTETASSGCTKRFIHAFDLILIAAAKEVDNRAKGLIPDLESYTILRRNVSGCKSCFALFEYAAQINLPDEVASHPVIMAMEDAANDYASWCNVMSHYVVESYGTANIIADRIFAPTTKSNRAMTQIQM